MRLFISHQSALEYWRLHHDTPHISASRRMVSLPNTPPKMDLLQAEKIEGLAHPLHAMLGSPNARRVSCPVIQHVYTGKTPAGCFVNAGEGIMITSPEFCFLQLADELPLVNLIELGYELCGTYSMPEAAASKSAAAVQPEEPALLSREERNFLMLNRNVVPDEESAALIRGFHNRLPLTSKKKLETFLDQMPGAKNHKKAVRAIRYLSDESASPMETKLAMLLTLPYKLGGYHFPMPKHNSHIVPVKTAKRGASKVHYACDLFWPDYGLAVEYDSDSYHTGSERIASDSKKRNALALMGITVITVTSQQIRSVSELEKVVHVLAGNMGRRLWNDAQGFSAAHRELRKLLA